MICSKLEDLKGKVNSKIEELISSQQKLDLGKKDINGQISTIKKRISDVFSDLKENIDRKEQELLREADDFEDQNTKQIDNLLRLANGRAMNLSEHTHNIKDVLNNYDQQSACEFYSKNYHGIRESNTTEIPQLEQIANQAQNKFLIKAENINEIIEGLNNFKLDVNSLHLNMDVNLDEPAYRRNTAAYEERGRMTVTQAPSNIFELGYKNNSSLKTSVAKTMSKIKQNLVVDNPKQPPYYDPRPTKGTSFRNTNPIMHRE